MTRTLRRGGMWALLAGLTLGACATQDPGISPARDRFYFPTAVTLDPEWQVLYLANSNADLQYNGATINVLQLENLPADLGRVGEAVQAGKLDCHRDPFDATVWECPEEQFIDGAATIRIGNFPSELRVSPADPRLPERERRLFVPVRGGSYLLWAQVVRFTDAQGQTHYDLRCSQSAQGPCAPGSNADCDVWDCDDAHKVDFSTQRRKQLPSEPFGIELNPITAVQVDSDGKRRTCLDGGELEVACECGSQRRCASKDEVDCCIPAPSSPIDYIYVTHLAGGEVSFFTSEAGGVQLRDSRGGFFAPVGDIGGGFALATQRPGDPESLTYVSSRVDSTLASFVILQPDPALGLADPEGLRIVDATRAPVGAIAPGSDVRGLAFAPAGERLYVVDRSPSSLVALDMSPQDGGLPQQEPSWVVEVCSQPSVLQLGPDPLRPEAPQARLAYVVCFSAGQIYVVDTERGRVVDQIVTGKGPNGLAIDTRGRRAFVANFLDNTVGVIDLDPSHPTYNRMVLRIGRNENLVRTQ